MKHDSLALTDQRGTENCLWTIEETAWMLRISRSKVRKLIKNGLLSSVFAHGYTQVHPGSIEQYISDYKVKMVGR